MSLEVQKLSNRLLNASKVTDEKNIASELQQRLSTPAFCAALGRATADGGSNGWSTMLKAVVVKLTGERKSSHGELVNALSRLVEEADKAGALFEGKAVFDVVGHILDSLFDESSEKLYWSVLSALASQAEYFRAVGREAAQQRCKQLAQFAWDTLLPEEGGGGSSSGGRSGGARKTMRSSTCPS